MQCYESLMTSLEWNLSLQKLHFEKGKKEGVFKYARIIIACYVTN